MQLSVKILNLNGSHNAKGDIINCIVFVQVTIQFQFSIIYNREDEPIHTSELEMFLLDLNNYLIFNITLHFCPLP